jgi:hypothetical protein
MSITKIFFFLILIYANFMIINVNITDGQTERQKNISKVLFGTSQNLSRVDSVYSVFLVSKEYRAIRKNNR